MFKKLLLALTLFSSVANAEVVNIQYEPEDVKPLTVEPFKTKQFQYAGENDILKMYINTKLIYQVSTKNVFDDVRASPIRMELKTDQGTEKAGTNFISYMYFDCINKSNMILFLHVYNKDGQFVREELNRDLIWTGTQEKTNTRLLNEYICKQ